MTVGRLARPSVFCAGGRRASCDALERTGPGALAEDPCIALNGNPIQGGVLWGVASPSAKISFAGLSVPVMPDGSFLLGLGRDMPSDNQLRDYPSESTARRQWWWPSATIRCRRLLAFRSKP